jgi:hypothetical protein
VNLKLKIFWIALAWLGTSLLAGLVITYFLMRPSHRVVAQWRQTTNVQYQSSDPYSLSVLEKEMEYFMLPWQPRYEIFVGRGTSAPAYGHSVRYSFHPGYANRQAHIRSSSVEWSPDGVTFIEGSGHRLFIPKAMFIGGR